MSIVLFATRPHLTPVTSRGDSFVCEGMASWGAYCVLPDPYGSVAVLAILGAVCLGLAPLATGALHAWASFSIATGIGLPDGGEHAAQVVTLLVMVMLVPDMRKAAWSRVPTTSSQVLLGISKASWWILRLQMVGIYLHSAIAKLGVEDWVNGSAMYYVVRDPSFGASGPVGDMMRWVTTSPLGVAALTWGSIAVEIAIAILLLHRGTARVLALGLAVALHAAIIITIGLWSFGLVMIGAMVVAAAPERLFVASPRTAAARLLAVFRRTPQDRGGSSSWGS
jgi:antimicrobial peptide system SdpB family protein